MHSAVTAAALLAVSLGSAVDAAPRAPTGKWVVDFDDAQCVASRNYGTEESPLLLALKQPPIGEVMQVAVIRKGRGNAKYADQVDAKIGVDDAKPVPVSMIKFVVKERGERVVLMNLPLDQFASVRNSRSLSISALGEFNETFQLADIESLMKVMDSCVADLRKIWNVDVAGNSSLQSSPKGTLQGLFRANDYPGIAISRMKGGLVSLVVLINEQGRVADCTVVQTSGVAALDAQSCAVVTERARFQPAIGKDGKPAKSTFRQRITWRIE